MCVIIFERLRKGSRANHMKNLLRKLAVPLAVLFLLSWVLLAATPVNAGPRDPNKPPCRVPEPGTLAMLGTGLVSVGLYALKKSKRR